MRTQTRLGWIPLLALAIFVTSSRRAFAGDPLEDGFQHPPASARPWVYWFPLDGNITSNGITADLEAMQRVGIGGVLYMETSQGTPPGPAKFGGPLWRNLFKHICAEASRLGLQVNMNNDAGWCGSGGPWITPELSMQRIASIETNVTGPLAFAGVLPQPKAVAGYYRDIALFAFPTPASNYFIPHIRGKAAETREEIPLRASHPQLAPEAVIPAAGIVNLTDRLTPDGKLLWNVPAGRWTLLRIGHTTTGKDNHPAPIDGRGLESDKLSRQATEAHFAGLMQKLIEDSKPLVGEQGTLVSTHIDSWETGSQNWTPSFREDFRRLRGYDPLPLLPVMTGRPVDSLEIAERFLWDVRMTVNDLLLENYAGGFRELAHQNGMRLSIEAYDGCPVDDLTYAGRADEPMGEFWSWARFGAAYSCTEMSSAAHVYGRPIVGAEAFTATDAEKWQGHPGNIKDLGDWAFCEGINRFVFHRYALQPWTKPDHAPGISMGPWGLHYERTQTWWEQSRAWHEYLARCQFLLQQGLFVADLCFLAPERSPQQCKSPVKSGYDRPGYNFDACPPEVIQKRMAVRNGRLTLPDGMSYRMLVLPNSETMTPELLAKVKELVAAGATVVGAPPLKSPSLRGYPNCDNELRSLVLELWGGTDAPAQVAERAYGQGRIIWGGEFRLPSSSDPLGAGKFQDAKWIWSNEGNPAIAAPPGKRYFRRRIVLDSPIASARLILTADNSFECWLNGRRVGSGDNFNHAYSFDVAPLLHPGTNLVTVEAVNATESPNPAGLIGTVAIRYANGQAADVPTDARWEVATRTPNAWRTDPAPAASAEAEWRTALELGSLGMAPWGEVAVGGEATDPIPNIQSVIGVLKQQGVAPDFSAVSQGGSEGLRYIHKTLGAADLYFVANKNAQAQEALCSFRVSNKRPELWWPDTGHIERPAIYDFAEGVLRIPIRLEAFGSVFVILREGAQAADRGIAVLKDGERVIDSATPRASANIQIAHESSGGLSAVAFQAGRYELLRGDGKSESFVVPAMPLPLELAGPWQVRFQPGRGAPSAIILDKLISWSDHPDPGVRYFSGTADYEKAFDLPPDWASTDRQVLLDLGQVAVMAEVKLNGQNLGILWKAPFRVNISGACRPGENRLELKVVNLWINRLIGDEQLPEDSERHPDGPLKAWPAWVDAGQRSPSGRYAFTSWRLWKKDSPLQVSGLLGPVRIECAEVRHFR